MSTSNNTITITECDNQLALYAVNMDNLNSSVQICDIQSGYNNKVDVQINLVAGSTASDTINLNGVNGPLTPGAQDFALPAGNYALVYTGLNWGGPTQFAFDFNTYTPHLPVGTTDKVGAVWNLGNLDMTFAIS
ncbi:MAG: hypothetical protein HEP71_24515 [Roseivirga sp.]|nr:hypothetical protein [Roseivirga sp.]